MKWWRLHEDSGTVYADYSAYSTGPWVNVANCADPVDFSFSSTYFSATSSSSGGSPGVAQFAFFNQP